MQTQLETSASEPTTLAPAQLSAPDTLLNQQLETLRQAENRITALRSFLRDHRQALAGLSYHVSPSHGEVCISVFLSREDEQPAAIAAFFPGDWQTSCKSWLGLPDHRDWLAQRQGVTIRLCSAERLGILSSEPQTRTF